MGSHSRGDRKEPRLASRHRQGAISFLNIILVSVSGCSPLSGLLSYTVYTHTCPHYASGMSTHTIKVQQVCTKQTASTRAYVTHGCVCSLRCTAASPYTHFPTTTCSLPSSKYPYLVAACRSKRCSVHGESKTMLLLIQTRGVGLGTVTIFSI